MSKDQAGDTSERVSTSPGETVQIADAPKKKKWVKPEVRQINAGSAENSNKPGNDGSGGQTNS